MGDAVFGIIGAMIGAGFASGREIMSFFSRYGAWSWPLILWNVGWTAGMMGLLLRFSDENECFMTGRAGCIWLTALLSFAAGGMTAAAGELTALTAPVRYARPLGGVAALVFCLLMSRRALKASAILARLLIPGLLIALISCLRVPASGAAQTARIAQLPGAFLRAAGYAGLNVTLSLGVLLDAGRGKSIGQKRKMIILSGIALLAAAGLCNAALTPHSGAMGRAALPTVLLLRSYGKTGYYLSAAVLYLAVISTLIAALRGMRALIPGPLGLPIAGLLSLAASLIGFQDLVEAAYPALGLISIAMLTVRIRIAPESRLISGPVEQISPRNRYIG